MGGKDMESRSNIMQLPTICQKGKAKSESPSALVAVPKVPPERPVLSCVSSPILQKAFCGYYLQESVMGMQCKYHDGCWS